MPKDYPRFFRWLVIAAVAEWLLGRTLSRSAIFMPKSPLVLVAYQAMTVSAQLASTAAALLAAAALLWIAGWLVRHSRLPLAIVLAAFVSLSLAMLLYPPSGELALVIHLLVMLALLGMTAVAMRREQSWIERLTWGLPAGAVAAGQLFHAANALQTVLGLPGPSSAGPVFFNLGEILVVAAGILLGWFFVPRSWSWKVLLIAAIPGLAFAALYLAAPAMAGVLAIWSVGLTLFLPWPLYVISLSGWAAAAASQLARGSPSGLGLPLLIAGGYAPQLSLQLSLLLIALWLLAAGRLGPLPAPGISFANPWRHSVQPEG